MWLTEQLGRAWSGLSYSDLPSSVVGSCKEHVLDTLAVAIAGASTPEARRAVAALAGPGGDGRTGVTVWGTDLRLAPSQAALANGTAAHARDFDDTGGVDHSGAVVIPAVLAAAEASAADGPTVIAAAVAGYDVGYRILLALGGYAVHNGRGWHSTGTVGTFAAAAGASKCLGLGAEQFGHALGIAGSFAGGVWAFLADSAMTKRLHAGKAAETGLEAALLAQAEFTGPGQIMEAEWGGFYTTYNGGVSDPPAALDNLGHEFLISNAGIKPYACCRAIHSAIDAMLALIDQRGLDAGDITRLLIHASRQSINMVSVDPVTNVFSAQFSMPYALAVAACSGSAGLDQFDPPRTGDPRVRDFMSRTSMILDPAIPNGDGPRLDVTLSTGERLTLPTSRLNDAKGAPWNPLSHEEVVNKAISLIQPRLGAATARRIVSCIDQLDALSDINHLTSMLNCSPN